MKCGYRLAFSYGDIIHIPAVIPDEAVRPRVHFNDSTFSWWTHGDTLYIEEDQMPEKPYVSTYSCEGYAVQRTISLEEAEWLAKN
jgi:hypothetical protein